ncbi:MAG: Segregation and condensation protein A [Sporanaerobacter sp.]|jgi:segregation and condensation protein A|uniref:segregation and condensation protein A n=1 Tax=Sporanaerobacter sp. TaxID=2010183 RepID=UPI003A0FF518
MEYKIVLNAFEGPLDLLLHLIERAKVDIYDIPISEITNQYMGYLSQMNELDLGIASEFLVMASTLLEIKSKMLLPSKVDNSTDQLEMEEIDPRVDLVKKLVEYKKYKKIAEELKIHEEIQNKVFYKPREDMSYYAEEELDLEEMNLEQLVDVLNNVLRKREKKNKTIDIDEIERDEITIEESIDNLKNLLESKHKIKFSQLFDDAATRSDIIVTFLSILELAKQKYILIRQYKNFDDIILIKK